MARRDLWGLLLLVPLLILFQVLPPLFVHYGPPDLAARVGWHVLGLAAWLPFAVCFLSTDRRESLRLSGWVLMGLGLLGALTAFAVRQIPVLPTWHQIHTAAALGVTSFLTFLLGAHLRSESHGIESPNLPQRPAITTLRVSLSKAADRLRKRLSVTPAGSQTSRCPFCHESSMDPDSLIHLCLDCRTLYHAECVDEAGGCVTLGCAQRGRKVAA